ncbi:hypothetical protein FHS18_003399 [Paenibacillus phyllosphaerae]|uniref:Copper amine oxidase-like N-terminal domain-containing protein n=1 Tax=Paenibacillus phyllosphaerae TaxID=274593 RepID=A0A7W5AZW4_9BACL|nr:copper amine oxidase N-terminal domain-containing protein [Paenibacillus phyllosphaerae]MBB3111331.1 hypothetical protein [Paenibacillus phyllosphaerae]
MKKCFLGILLGSALMLVAPTAYAADIQIKVDGVAIASDVKPELKNNHTMVPLRVISEHLGANVEWSNSAVTITKGDMKLILHVNQTAATLNGKAISLDSKPYIKNNRVFVPLRFIAEAFGSNVNYRQSVVTVDTEPLLINGVEVQAVQEQYHMTMGGVVQQVHGHAFNHAIYEAFTNLRGQKVEPPASYSWSPNIDTPGHYYKNAQYDLVDSKGNSLQQFDIYTLLYPNEATTGYPIFLLHDASADEWYLFSETANQAIQTLIATASRNGHLQIISNTVV